MEEGVEAVATSIPNSNGSGVAKGSWLAPYQFKPGESGNPLGRKRDSNSLAAYIREKSLQGTAIADFLFEVVGGNLAQFSKMKDRIEAAALLLNRGWGQAPQVITLQDGPNKPIFDLSKLSDEKFQSAKKLLEILSEAVDGPEKAETASTVAPGMTISPPDVPKVQP